MIAPRSSPPSLRETLTILSRHKGKMIGFFTVVVAFTAAITFLLPKTYRSEGKLLVRLGRENLAADPTATLGSAPVLSVQQTRENEINSVIEILRNRVLMEKVIDTVGAAKLFGYPEDEDVSRENTLRLVKNSLDVEAVRKSNVIQVTYDAPSPELAQEVCNLFIEYFLDDYIRLNRTPGGDKFLADQTAQIRERLTQKEEELRKLKNETGLASPAEQRAIIVNRTGRLKDELLQVATALVSTEEEVRKLREQLAALPERSVSEETKGIPNEAADGMRQQLYALEIREQELSAKVTDNHPQLQQVREQIADAKKVLESEARERPQTKTSINKPHEEVQLQLLRQEPILAALRVKAELLETQLAAEEAAQKKLADDELRVAQLERDVKLEEQNYQKHVESLEQASIDRELAEEGKSNISIVQPATYELKPVKPKVLINMGLGIAVGLLGAVALAMAANSLDDRLRTSHDVESQLDLPVLASLPRFKSAPLTPQVGGK